MTSMTESRSKESKIENENSLPKEKPQENSLMLLSRDAGPGLSYFA
jgi:hypothetical protein